MSKRKEKEERWIHGDVCSLKPLMQVERCDLRRPSDLFLQSKTRSTRAPGLSNNPPSKPTNILALLYTIYTGGLLSFCAAARSVIGNGIR